MPNVSLRTEKLTKGGTVNEMTNQGEEKNPAYEALGRFYDQLINQDYDYWLAYLRQLFDEFGVKPRQILDIGCGTGNITIPLVGLGYVVVGVDPSHSMLAAARAKAAAVGLSIDFLEQRVQELTVDQMFDAAISTCDSLNYVLEENVMVEAFARIHRHVRPGGLFLFDLNSELKLSAVYGGNAFAELYDEFAYFWENEYTPADGICEMDLTFFVQEPSGQYRRVREVHHQRYWPCTLVEKMLHDTGWSVVGRYDFGTQCSPHAESQRWQFAARRL